MIRVDFAKLRFLVVDDNQHMRRILRALLHGFGSRDVHEAADGATALDQFHKFMPDIVLVDWAMPMVHGLEFTQVIRQQGTNPNPFVPIIMLTGHSERERVMAARDAGITEFMVKPVSAGGLYRRILNVVAAPRPFIRTASYFGPDRRRSAASSYKDPERRKGTRADTIQMQGLIEKAKLPGSS
jgi:two-component system, chemotaxis family, chemotaxis protein CheY